MVPQRSLVTLACALLVVLTSVSAQEAKKAARPAEEPKVATKPQIPIESKPYVIRAFVSFEPAARIDARSREQLIDEWRMLAARMIGPVWDVKIADSDGPASASRLEDLSADDLRVLGNDVDKVWIIQGRAAGSAIELHARELDVETGWLGSHHERLVAYRADLARELFRLTNQIFAPSAEIGEPKGDIVPLRVQGASFVSGQGTDPLAPPGTIFRPIRVFLNEDGSRLSIEKILYSYLRVTKHEGDIVETSLIRGVRDPLTKRIARKNKLIALGVKPAPMPTRFRFTKLPDKTPAAGYVLSYRQIPDGVFRELATTDREGRVNLPPGFADGLVIFRLTAGKAEPMFDLPVMPGELDEELVVPFEPKPHAITVHAQLDALRDAILDIVAIRSRLERRMKAREQGDDWNGVAEVLAEFNKLTPRDVYIKRLEAIEGGATAQEAKLKTIVLTKNVRSQIADTKSMITRYMDDEIFHAYKDAVERAKERDAANAAAAAKKAKAAAKKAAPAAKPAAPAPEPAQPAATTEAPATPF